MAADRFLLRLALGTALGSLLAASWGASHCWAAPGAPAGSALPVDPALARAAAREYAAAAPLPALRAPALAAGPGPGSGPWAGLAADGASPPPPGRPLETLPPVEVDRAGAGAPASAPRMAARTYARVPSFSTRVGPNNQPAWTTHRRFATVRSYVIAPGQVEFESWWEGKFKKDGDERHRFLEEVSLGLPGRLQLDLYWRIQSETGEDLRTSDFQFELRWALARWGCLPLNPTLYAEYKVLDEEPDVAEAKLLLSDELGCRTQWSANAFYERQLGGDEEVEWGVSAGLAFTLVDPTLSVGVEAVYESTSVKGARGDPEQEVLLGPTIQWRPFRGVHLDVAPLFGLTDDSPDAQIWVVLGIDLCPGSSVSSSSPTLPISSRSR